MDKIVKCSECGDAIYREGYNVNGVILCYRCMKEKHAFRVDKKEEPVLIKEESNQ